MSIPNAHLAKLKIDLKEHNARVSSLRTQIDLLQDEIFAHTRLISFATDPRVHELLAQLSDGGPEAARKLMGNEHSEMERLGLRPSEGRAKTTVGEDGEISVAMDFVQRGYAFRLKWSSKHGFSSGSTTIPPAKDGV